MTCAFGAFAEQTILAGKVVDAATAQPIVAAKVSVLRGTSALGNGPTDPNGRYQIAFEVERRRGVETLALRVTHDSYAARQINFQLKNGEPFQPPSEVNLLSAPLATCRADFEHAVVIGDFRPPLGQNFPDLPGRIAEALHFFLTTRLQQVRIPVNAQPVFAPCPGARPRVVLFGKRMARALEAHAFVYGNLANDRPPFDVSTYVVDSYDLFPNPWVVKSKSVDLNDPSSARMSPEIYAAVLASMAAGLTQSESQKCELAMKVVGIAEELVLEAPFLKALREKCTAVLPHRGLLVPEGDGS